MGRERGTSREEEWNAGVCLGKRDCGGGERGGERRVE